MTALEKIKTLGACYEAKAWVMSLPKRISAQKAWDTCVRGDWMLWLIAKSSGNEWGTAEHRKLAGVCGLVAKQSLKYVRAGENRPAAALALVRRYASGEEIGRQELRDAADAAYASAASAAADAAAASADADAASYAYAASSASYAASSASYAASASYAYAASYERSESLKKSANIVRKHYPKPPKIKTEKCTKVQS